MTELKPGEYIARALIASGRDADGRVNSITYRDIVVTAETLPIIRASGEYLEVRTPKAMREE